MFKMHLKKNSIVSFYGENYVINFDHWTTVDDYREGINNLRISVATRELFSKSIGTWPHIALDREDIEVIPL